MRLLTLLLSVTCLGAMPSTQVPSSPWSSAADLEILKDARESLRGVSRVAVIVNAPDTLGTALSSEALQSTLASVVGQAGLVIVQTRELEDPVLSVNLHVIVNRNAQGVATGWIYRVYADLMQLVRLSDYAGKARIMLASTWHAGSHGTVEATDATTLRERVMEIVNAFLDDYRAANAPPSPPRATP